MKKLKLILFIGILTSFTANSQTDYSKGWKNGYKEGYCYGYYGCVAPVAPVSPVPRAGESSYKDGYNRGFVKGKKDRQAKNNTRIPQRTTPTRSNGIGRMVEENTRYWTEQNDLKRSRTQDQYRNALKKAVKAFEEERYADCIKLYNSSKGLGWYDSNFEFAAGASYYFAWIITKDKKHYKQAKKLLKLSVKHGNTQAKKILKEIKKMK